MILMERQGVKKVMGKNCDIQGSVTRSCLGNDVTVGSESRINSSVIFDDVSIGKHSRIEECIVGEGCRIGKNVHLVQSIVGDGESIGDTQSIQNTSIWTKPIPKGYPKGQIGNVVRG
jgi:ADP-glucose pyrophosphorylase